MSYEEIKSRLNKVFCKVFKESSLVITEDTTAKDIEKWDSLTHLILISTTESEFGIKFKLKELIAMKNVGDFLRSIESKLSA
jgi:acyl carrier protein